MAEKEFFYDYNKGAGLTIYILITRTSIIRPVSKYKWSEGKPEINLKQASQQSKS